MATQDYKITVKANDQQDVSGPVNFIRLHASSANLKIDIDGKVTELAVGQAIVLDALIDKFVVKNESGADISATLKLGAAAQIIDNNLSGTVTESKATTNADDADTVIAALGTLVIAADSLRRALVISSGPANIPVCRVSKTGGARGDYLQPGMSVIVNATDAISIYNPDAVNAATMGIRYEKD